MCNVMPNSTCLTLGHHSQNYFSQPSLVNTVCFSFMADNKNTDTVKIIISFTTAHLYTELGNRTLYFLGENSGVVPLVTIKKNKVYLELFK